MNGFLFAGLCTITLLLIVITYKKRIVRYIGSNPYYYCWAIMMVSNLGFPGQIQYVTRLLGVAISLLTMIKTERFCFELKKNRFATVLFFYIAFCMFSTIYSNDKLQTFIKSIELFTDLMLIWLIYSKEGKKAFTGKVLNITMLVWFSLITLSLAGSILLPDYFLSYTTDTYLGVRLTARFLSANGMSFYALVCFVWLLLLDNRRTYIRYIMLVICVLVMLLAQSRTTLVFLPVALVGKLFAISKKKTVVYWVFLAAAFMIIIAEYEAFVSYFMRGQNVESLVSLTGRANMWAESERYISANPFWGYGFGVGGELVAEELFGIGTMHSAFYETLLGTGVIGFSFIALQVFLTIFSIVKNTIKHGLRSNVFDILLVLILLVTSYTSEGIANWHSPIAMLWYYFMFSLLCGVKNVSEEHLRREVYVQRGPLQYNSFWREP